MIDKDERVIPACKMELFQEIPRVNTKKDTIIFHPDNSAFGTFYIYRDGSVNGNLRKFNPAQIDEIMRMRSLFRRNLSNEVYDE